MGGEEGDASADADSVVTFEVTLPTAVGNVVLDAKVLIWPSRVVACGQNDAAWRRWEGPGVGERERSE